MRTSTRSSILALLLGLTTLILTACGSGAETATETATEADVTAEAADAESSSDSESSDSESSADSVAPVESETAEDKIVVEATTSTVAEAVTTTEVAKSQIVLPEGQDAGLGSFALRVFETGELGFTPEEQGCVDGRLQSELRTDRSVEFDVLEIPEQAKSIEILLDCAGGRLEGEFLSEFDTEAFDDLALDGSPEELGLCIYRELLRDDDNQPLVLLALSHITADMDAPPETVTPAAELFASCFDLGALLINEFKKDPNVAEVIDLECVEAVVDDGLNVELFATVLADVDAADSNIFPESFGAITDCMRFGAAVAQGFAGQATLSDTEIACIDEAFRDDEIANAMLAGTDLPASAEGALIACLSAETLQALGG